MLEKHKTPIMHTTRKTLMHMENKVGIMSVTCLVGKGGVPFSLNGTLHSPNNYKIKVAQNKYTNQTIISNKSIKWKGFGIFNLSCLYSIYGSGVLGLIARGMEISKQKDSRIYYAFRISLKISGAMTRIRWFWMKQMAWITWVLNEEIKCI